MSARTFWQQAGGLSAVGVITALALGTAFMSIGSSQEPRDVPIAAVGEADVAATIEGEAPEQLDVDAVPDLEAAREAIADRDVYGAVVPGPAGVRELLVASAANNGVANFLRRTLGAPTPENVPQVTDVVPLPDEDASGVDVALLLQALLIGGSIAVVGFSKIVPRYRSDPRRGVFPFAALFAYAALFSLALASIAAAFGVGTDASFVDTWLAMGLLSLATAASTAALVAVIGPAGTAVTGVLYFILGSQISGAGAAPEFLPSFWSGLGQALPAGAGTDLIRRVFYFPDASVGEPVAILAAYAAAGMVAIIALNLVRTRRPPEGGEEGAH
jgi:hypothetical protein